MLVKNYFFNWNMQFWSIQCPCGGNLSFFKELQRKIFLPELMILSSSPTSQLFLTPLRLFAPGIVVVSKQISWTVGPENIQYSSKLPPTFTLLTKQENLYKSWRIESIFHFPFLKLLFKLYPSWTCREAHKSNLNYWLKHAQYIIITATETLTPSVIPPQKQSNSALCQPKLSDYIPI